MDKVEIVLREYGPMLSGDLARIYQTKYNVSNDAARQALSRSKSPVQKINSISFEKNQMFYYLESQFMSEKYKKELLKAIKEYSVLNDIYITVFLSQAGYISKAILPAFVSSPVKKVRGHKLHQRVIDDLLKCKIIEEFDDEHWMLSPQFFDEDRFNFSRAMGLEVAKKLIINDFNQWAREINFVGFNSGKCLFEVPEFANFQWAYTAPSYIQTLYNSKKEKPGFVVADVIYGKTATVDDVRFFINKINIIRSFKKVSNFIPILLVDRLEDEALRLLKENKVIIAILNNFFNRGYAELLADLVNVFANATAIILNNPEMIQKLFDDISKSEGRYNNIAGDLFELLVGNYYQTIGCSYIRMKKIIQLPDTGKNKELDVFIERDGKTIECKASRSKLSKEFIEKWLSENIPLTRKWLLSNYPEKRDFEFQLWSVGGFDDESSQLLQHARQNNNKYEITYYDLNNMIELAKANNAQMFLNTLRQHFI